MIRILMIVSIFASCAKSNCNDEMFHKVSIGEGIVVIIPTVESKYDDEEAYSNVQFCINGGLATRDSVNHYFLLKRNGEFPMGRILANGECEIIIEASGLPLDNYFVAYRFRGSVMVSKFILPLLFADQFSSRLKGQLYAQEDTGKVDSCFYNPMLYFENSKVTGLKLDSSYTISINSKMWGKFAGFEGTDEILPCPK